MLLADLGADVVRIDRPGGHELRRPRCAPGSANRTHVWRPANKVNLVNLKAGNAPDNAEGRSDGARSTLTVGSAQICPDAAERPSRLRTGKTSEEQERRWHPIRQSPR
ncbi:hypothetical protein [Streptomyces decoyicus]|uniref:hypothetical protein n=1 Tax=Streptomyces decoyicus TaxID=249567 RepID=UPI0038694BA5